jgi:hypothetical protein
MDLYDNVETSSQNVLAALKIKEDVNARVERMKESGARNSKVKAAEKQAAIVAELVDRYEATFVPTGRTLAEIINLPAKIFTKMIWLHNMMEVTEGPVTQSMRDVYTQLNEERDEANLDYKKNISEAMEKFESVSG